MSHHHAEYDAACPSCRPVLLNANGQPLTGPAADRFFASFEAAPLELREAWFRVAVKNSSAPADLVALDQLSEHMSAANPGGVPVSMNPLVAVGLMAGQIVTLLSKTNLPFLYGLAAVRMAELCMLRALKDPNDDERSRAMARELFSKGSS